MKKWLLVLMVLFVIGFMGCDNGTTGGGKEQMTKFEGTWKHPNPQAQNATYKFTGNNWQFTIGGGSTLTGTFTFTDSDIVFTITAGGQGTWKQGYTLTDTILTLSQVENHMFGPFIKQ
jgi:hypothetical protein